jgi:hypothetical protein
MPKAKYTVVDAGQLSHLIGRLRSTLKAGKPFRVEIDTSKPRSISQNAILHKWCSIVAQERGEGSMIDVKNFVKLHIFAPILCADSDEFNEAMELVVRGLSEEEQLKAIQHIDVTSACSTEQMSKGLEQMVDHYAGLGVDAVMLEFPEE